MAMATNVRTDTQVRLGTGHVELQPEPWDWRVAPRRGDTASAIWTDYAGLAVHDRFAAYWTRQLQVIALALCNAHLLRNLQEVVELEEAPNGWAARLQRLLHEAHRCARGAAWLSAAPSPPAVGSA